MIPVLRRRKTMIQHALDGVSRSLDLGREGRTLRRAEVPENERCGVHPARRAPDSYPHPQVLASAERLRDRAQAVVAVVATAVLDPQGAKVDVEFVMDDDQLIEGDVEERLQTRDRPSRLVHVGPRLGQDQPSAG